MNHEIQALSIYRIDPIGEVSHTPPKHVLKIFEYAVKNVSEKKITVPLRGELIPIAVLALALLCGQHLE